MKIKVGVMGTSEGKFDPEIVKKVYKLGEEIANRGCALLTGGCPGLPYEATKGAKAQGGMTIGISPGLTLEEHIDKYHSPVEGIDVMIYTGSGLMGREVTAVRSCDIIIIVGGRSGTLGEFAIAYDEGRLIGVLEGSGGIADEIKRFVEIIKKPTGSQIIYNPDPVELIAKLLEISHSMSN
ncbi:MAG: hypothetical protein ABIF11_04925 [Nitrospirota bacterium]